MGKLLENKEGFSSNNKIVVENKASRKYYKAESKFAWKPASKEEIRKERVPSLQMVDIS